MVNKQEPVSSTNIFGGPSARSYTATTSGNIFGGPNAVVRPSAPTPVVPAPIPAKQKFQNPFKGSMTKIGDVLSRPKFMQDIGRGLAESGEESMSERILKTTASFVGGSSPENLPLGVGEVIKQSKEYLNTPEIPDVTFRDWLIGMKQAGQGFVSNVISGATELPNIVTAGKYQPEIKLKIPGIGEVTNSDYRIAQRVSAGENPNVAVITEKANGFLNALFFLGLTSRAFTYRHTPIAKTTRNFLPTEKGVVTAPPIKSFQRYTPPTYTQKLSPSIIEGLKKDGLKFRVEPDPNLPTYFKMTRGVTGKLKMEIVQVRHSYFSKFRSEERRVGKECQSQC
jgi:hypothetical protein